MAKTEAAVTCEPPWALPDPAKLQPLGAPALLDKQFRLHNRGLRKIAIEAMKVRSGSGKQVGIFQKFVLALDDGDRPRWNPALLSRLVYFRAGQFALDTEHPVTFRIYLNGQASSTDKEWERQVRFTIDPDDLDDAFEDEEEDDEPDEDRYEGAQDDAEEEYDDEYDDEESDDEPAPPLRARAQREHAELVGGPPASTLHPAVQISPIVAEAQRLGLPVPQGTPIQVNPDFIVQIISESQSAAVRFFEAAGRENRRAMRTVRRECTAIAREARRTMKAVTDDALEQRRIANSHAEKLGQQLIDTTELNASHYENFQKIAQQGWTAFRHSMETEMAQFERMREYERTIYGERIARAEEAAALPVSPSAWPGMLNRAIPGALAVGAAVMAERGNTGMANLLGNLANLLTPKQLDDDDYDDDDDEGEEPPRRARRASSNGHADHAAPPASEPEPEPTRPRPPTEDPIRPAPTRDGTRDLFQSLSPDQVVKLREKMPRGAWEAFEEAANARSESTARAAIARLDALVRHDQVAQASVLSILKPEQSAKLFEMIQKPPRRTAPPRPSASASPG